MAVSTWNLPIHKNHDEKHLQKKRKQLIRPRPRGTGRAHQRFFHEAGLPGLSAKAPGPTSGESHPNWLPSGESSKKRRSNQYNQSILNYTILYHNIADCFEFAGFSRPVGSETVQPWHSVNSWASSTSSQAASSSCRRTAVAPPSFTENSIQRLDEVQGTSIPKNCPAGKKAEEWQK